MPRSAHRPPAARAKKAGLPGRTLALVSLFALSLAGLVSGLAPFTSQVEGQSKTARGASGEPARAQLERAFDRLPLSFEANRGQADSHVKFQSVGDGYTLSLSATGASLSLQERPAPPTRPERLKRRDAEGKGGEDAPPAEPRRATLTMKLLGANPRPEITGVDELPGKSNYLVGASPDGWRTDVPTYAKVRYGGVYPGVDMVYYGDRRKLEYDFVVAPGADPRAIRLDFRGAERVELDPSGDLVLHTALGEVRQSKPFTYQEVAGERREVESRYALAPGGEVGFEVGEYDPALPLVIDPVLVYSTLLNFTTPDTGGVVVDAAGNVYLTGRRNAAVYVAKINAAGTAFAFQTYVGGASENGALGTDIAVDASGNIYVGGDAWALDMPVVNAYQPTKKSTAVNESDAYVFKLAPNGSTIVYATYLGGYDRDDCYAIAVDASGNAYVTGYTESPVPYANAEPGAPFPTANAYQPKLAGDNDAFLTKFDPRGGVVYSTYLGGLTEDIGLDVAVDSDGAAYVTGVTDSTDFPVANAYQSALAGNGDLFVTKFNPQGSALVYSTYLGGLGEEIGWGVALDSARNVYLAGYTYGSSYPTKNAFQATFGGMRDAFVTKLNAAGSDLVYSTFLGGADGDGANDIFVDGAGAAYVVGDTFSTDFPVRNAVRPTGGDGSDAFVSKLDPAGASLVYSTYFGGGEPSGIGADYGNAVFADASGNAYVLGTTNSNNFAPVVNPMQTAGSAFLVKMSPARDETFWRVRGVVTDGKGNAIPGATVTLSGAAQQTTTTNGFGGYSFNGVRAGGDYVVRASSTGRTFAPGSKSLPALSADALVDFDQIYDTYYIAGTLTDDRGAAMSGVTVKLTGSATQTTTTSPSGYYIFASLPRGGTYTVTPAKAEYTFTPQSQTFASMVGDKQANFSGAPSNGGPTLYKIAGQVTYAGAPMAGVAVTLGSAQATPVTVNTDAAGNYAFQGLAPGGSYTVWASKANYMFTPQSQYFSSLSGNQTVNFDAALVSYTVSGRVTLAGAGLAGVLVQLTGSESAGAVTDANGNYSYTLTAGGNYTLTPSKAGYTFSPAGATFNNLGANQTADFLAAAPQLVNYALASNGGVASASSTTTQAELPGLDFSPAGVINGDRRGLNWEHGGGWRDATNNSFPDWLQVDFNSAKNISEVGVFSLQDNYASPAEPTEQMTFTKYGVSAFDVHYWDGAQWAAVPGASVVGNDRVWRKVTFEPVTTTRLRVIVRNALAGRSRLVEVEAWGTAAAPPPPPPAGTRINAALASNGGHAVASSTTTQAELPGLDFSPAGVINGDRKGLNWEHGGGWRDATNNAFPDWLEVSFAAPTAVDEVNVFSLQDNYASPSEPTEAAGFTKYGVTSFVVQYWDGAQWQAAPGGAVTNNGSVWRRVTFPAVTTTRVRVVVNAALAGRSRLVEVEAWGVPSAARVNHAAAANGGAASASSTTPDSEYPGLTFPASSVVDGDRRGSGWEYGGGWRDGTGNVFPDWVEVSFAGARRVDEVGVFSLQDDYTSPVDPTAGMSFTKYGVTSFEVQYWAGAAWQTVPGGVVTENNLVWRKLTFTAVTTTKVRVVINNAIGGRSRLVEVEAVGPAS